MEERSKMNKRGLGRGRVQRGEEGGVRREGIGGRETER